MLLNVYENFVSFLKENKILFIIVFVILIALILSIIYIRNKKKELKPRKEQIRDLVTISIFASLSIILYLTFKFSLPIFPEFLKINFSNLPIILGAFLLGTKKGVLIVLIRTIIVLPFSGTFFVGELADLIISLCIVFISTYIYNKNRTIKGAIISLLSVCFTWIIVSALANYFILIPAYVELMFGGNEEVFISLLHIIPDVTVDNYRWKYILFGAIPFNAIISISVCIITFLTYKRLSIVFHKFDGDE